MSRLVPQRTIDALRRHVDISLDNFGVYVDLYVPTNLETIEGQDMFQTPTDVTFEEHLNVLAFINWSPNTYRLRELGLYVEGETPITAYFKGLEDIDVLIDSYIKVPIQYISNDVYKTNEFTIVNLLAGPMLDAQVRQEYKLAPRRITV